MNDFLLFGIFTSIFSTLAISIILIKKKCYTRAFTIFICLYVIGQIIGYGFSVDILKAVVPSFSDPENGVGYQIITSTGIPLLISFLIDYIYKFLKR